MLMLIVMLTRLDKQNKKDRGISNSEADLAPGCYSSN